MESKKVMTVAAMAMVLIILLSANMDTAGVAAQGLNCYDNCNTGCAGLSSEEYLRCDKECRERCKDEVLKDTSKLLRLLLYIGSSTIIISS
ncbi:uncharacterized protein LOC107840002 isoform X5 [Capsicum annuum]|uniref:uncharacterized protein LOC107840002 isoform X5 n=1 Tax=Capsicum annuum TaxID=4072 RepID=UPI001FB0911B|nr:uncharacterized protein LOC107840002 isoform X5 [Capsicum annuum]